MTAYRFFIGVAVASLAASSAFAQEAATDPNASSRPTTAAPVAAATVPFSISGAATLASQYRFRGISQSDEKLAVQGTATVTHESGIYAGFWGSNLAGFGTFGGANLELDLYAGVKKTFGKAAVDAGALYYVYPGTSGHDYIEPYANVSGTLGPVALKVGGNYAPRQRAIGNNDALYVYGEANAAIPSTPITLKSHLGYTTGRSATTSGPDGHYLDYAVGADLTYKALTFNVSYVGTDVNRAAADAFYTGGSRPGRKVAGDAVVASLTAAF